MQSKYEELKARIEKVEGWTASANELIQEIAAYTDRFLYICIPFKNSDMIEIQDSLRQRIERFSINGSQCSKLTAFKSALMWLLDNSSIKKDDKSDKIAELVRKLQELTAEIEKLRGEVCPNPITFK